MKSLPSTPHPPPKFEEGGHYGLIGANGSGNRGANIRPSADIGGNPRIMNANIGDNNPGVEIISLSYQVAY